HPGYFYTMRNKCRSKKAKSRHMKSLFLSILIALPLCVSATGTPRYAYVVDLENIVEDRVYVELFTPQISKNTIRFYLPKVVPGTYAIYDFGRFISEFRAEDVHGNLLHAERG